MNAAHTSGLAGRNWLWGARARLWAVDAGTAAACTGLAAYIAVLAVRGATLSSAVFLMSDAPAGPYLGAAFLNGQSITLPLHSEIVPTLLSGALAGLPAGHALVQLLGPALAVCATSILCLTLRDLGARWLFSAVLGLCAGPILLWSFLFPTAHVYTYVAMAVFAWAATRLASDRLSKTAVAGCVVIGATALLGDQSFLVTGLLPLAAAAASVSLRRNVRRRVAWAASILAGSAVFAVALAALVALRGLHLDTAAALRGAQGSSSQLLGLGASLATHSFGWMLSGSWYGGSTSPVADTLLAVAGLAIPVVAPLALWQHIHSAVRDDRRLAYLAFWAAVDILVLAAFLGLGYTQSIASGRYLIPCALAAVATVPLLRFPRLQRLRPLASVLVGAIAAVQAIGILTVSPAVLAGPQAPFDSAQVLRVLQSQGLTRGYADYWASYSLTWSSNERTHVYPVIPGCSGSGSLCPYAYAAPSWYVPASGTSFLLLRADELCSFGDLARFGTPQRSVTVDPDSTVLVYPYDIASRFVGKPSICF